VYITNDILYENLIWIKIKSLIINDFQIVTNQKTKFIILNRINLKNYMLYRVY